MQARVALVSLVPPRVVSADFDDPWSPPTRGPQDLLQRQGDRVPSLSVIGVMMLQSAENVDGGRESGIFYINKALWYIA
jgi:hypothetical protein